MSHEASLPPELVLRHGSALRALACALLRDTDEADEVVQETWLKLLQRPPRSAEGLGAWLSTVLKNLASNRRREAARRSARERAHARNEASDERSVQERDAALRAVVEAVLALEEPSKTVVMLRYFEGLAPREIAARLRVDASTVHSRLHRAHDKLRARLERELGPRQDWAAMLVALVGARNVRGPLAAGAASGGLVVLGAKTNALLVAAAAAGLAWVAWRAASSSAQDGTIVRNDSSRELAPAISAESSSADASVKPDEAGSERSATGESAPPAVAQRPWPAPSYEYTLEFQVTDDSDLPLGDCTVYAAPAGGTLNQVGSTDANGILRLRWKAYQPSMELDLSVRGEAHSPAQRIAVARGEQRLACRASSGNIVADFRPAVGSVATEEVLTGRLRIAEFARFGVATGSPETPTAVTDADGWTTFVEPMLVRSKGSVFPRLDQSLLDRFAEQRVSAQILDLGYVESIAVEGSLLRRPDPLPAFSVRGQVFDAEGRPVAGAPIYVRRKAKLGWNSVQSNDAGEYEIDDLDDGEYELRAGGGSLGLATRELVGARGKVATWDARLERGLELKGVLVDLDDQPLAAWRVEVASQDRSFADSATTDEQGRFTIPNLPGGSLALMARPNSGDGPPMLVLRAVRADGAELKIQTDLRLAQGFGSLRIELHDALAPDGSKSEVWMWRDDTGFGARVAQSGQISSEDAALFEGTSRIFERSDVLPGTYRIELRAPGCEPRTLANLFVAPGAPTDLGRIELAPSARLEFAPHGNAKHENGEQENEQHDQFGFEMLARNELLELHTGSLEVETPATLYLREGEYQHSIDSHGWKRSAFRASAAAPMRLDPDAVRSIDEPPPNH